METIETLIPDNKGNHLVVVLYFYDDDDKNGTFQIPKEFSDLDIADINIRKLDLNRPIGINSFFDMCHWLTEQFALFPNAVFSFICSTDDLNTNHTNIKPEQYRWHLFENLFTRNQPKLTELGIYAKNIIVGPPEFQTYAKVFYRNKHTPIIHIVADHLQNKWS
ncbi:MAG: hypothetical protein NC248_02870 [Bacteroides sp.]|nr:hypothetical protein [Bacteroides sp.]MCM1388724.1 hypothetical protein [Bacteroides sp.]